MELGRSAHIAQTAGALLYRLEPQLVSVKIARPLEVLNREFGDRARRAERSGHGQLLSVVVEVGASLRHVKWLSPDRFMRAMISS